MMKLSHEILLALTYVSQISDPDSVRVRFIESMNGLDEGFSFEWLDRLPPEVPEHRVFPIRTLHSSFGYGVMAESSTVTETEKAVFRNAFQFLAILLENRMQARALELRNEAFQKQAEETLATNDILLRIAGETAKFGGWSVDLNSRVCTWSEKVADIHEMPRGYSPPVPDAFIFYAPEWRNKITQVFTDCAEKGLPYDEEMEIITGDGRRVWVRTTGEAVRNEQGKIVKVQGSFQDITDRKKSEEQLAHSHDLMRYIIEHSNGAVAVHDLELKYIYVSQRYLEDYKLKEKNIIGKHQYDVFPDLPQKWKDVHQKALKGVVSRADRDLFCRGDGTVEWTRWECRPWYDAQGAIGGFIVYTEVITERVKAEDELRKLKDNLEKEVEEKTRELQEKVQKLDKSRKAMLHMVEDLNRMTAELKKERHRLRLSNEELEAFAYSVSHDLRAPLRAIDGFSQFLVDDYAENLDDEGKRFIDTIRRNAAVMDQLISDLLSLSRVSRMDMDFVQMDMRAIVESIYHESATEKEKKAFELTIQEMPPVSGDVPLIKQVWRNLIGNALKYSAKSPVKTINVSAEAQGKEVIFCVQDHGAGFDERYAHKLFGVFQRLHKDDEFEGTGVGLAIVQRIIHRHGGRVWAEGKTNEGAAFYFSLTHA